MKQSIILGIDTSCDDTSAGVVVGTTVLSNVIASQTQLHKPYGGVFPTVAKQAHRENITPVIAQAMSRAQISWRDIDGIAVTQGPGLAPALEVGIEHARQLAAQQHKPLFAVNHLEGHVLSVLARPNTRKKKITPASASPGARVAHKPLLELKSSKITQFPALAVIVSGGHTQFILVTAIGQYQIIGSTIDDAAGEALDKVGRMLDLGYPAGHIIEEFAKKGDRTAFEFPLPMTTSGDYNLSFSGLKTAARNLITQLETNQQQPLSQQQVYDFAASFQFTVFRHITHKLEKILSDHPEINSIWLGGGVAANITLRHTLRALLRKVFSERQKAGKQSPQSKPLPLLAPYTRKLCQDNGAMIALVAAVQAVKPTQVIDRQPRLPLTGYAAQ